MRPFNYSKKKMKSFSNNFNDETSEDFGALNAEIFQMHQEIRERDQNEKNEFVQKYENSFQEYRAKISELEKENESLKFKLQNSISIDQMNSQTRDKDNEIEKIQEKLKETEEKLYEQQQLTNHLKQQIRDANPNLNANGKNEDFQDLNFKLRLATEENANLQKEMAEMQEKHKLDLANIASQIIDTHQDEDNSKEYEMKIQQMNDQIKSLETKLESSEQMLLVKQSTLNTEIELRIRAEKSRQSLYDELKEKQRQYADEYAENEATVGFLKQLLKCSVQDIIPMVQQMIAYKNEAENSQIEKETNQSKIEALQNEIDRMKSQYVDRTLLEAERKRTAELNGLINRMKTTEDDLYKEIQNLKDENQKKIDEIHFMHQQELESFESDLAAAQERLKEMEQERENEEKMKELTKGLTPPKPNALAVSPQTTPHRSVIHSSNLSMSLQEMTAPQGNSDSDYILILNDAANTVIKFITDNTPDDTGLMGLAAFLEAMMTRPFDFDAFSKSAEEMIDTFQASTENMQKMIDLFDRMSEQYEGVVQLLENLTNRINDMAQKMKTLESTKKTKKKDKPVSRIPMLSSKPSRILSPSKRNLKNEGNPPSARQPFDL